MQLTKDRQSGVRKGDLMKFEEYDRKLTEQQNG